jgi:hypothetical protein
LGHDLIQTTEKYLGVEQDLTDAPRDHLGLRIGGGLSKSVNLGEWFAKIVA